MLNRCPTCDEWYEDPGPRAAIHKHPEPQSGPARETWLKSKLPYERWIIETPEGREWSEQAEWFGELAGKRFGCILADPPWNYKSDSVPVPMCPWVERGEKLQSAKGYYKTMTLAQIMSMPVSDISEANAVLFLWATVPLMPEAFTVMKAWGYRYKTMLTWEKENGKGMGYWFRGVTEHLLLGVRGDVKAFRSPVKNLISSKVGRHSAKPQQAHDIIESVTQGMKRVELFARLHRPGWTAWGNQVERDLYSTEPDDGSGDIGCDVNEQADHPEW